jgi:pimeloyl-ACP methyl ester carboxylesterase
MEAGPEQLRAFLEQARPSLAAITAEQLAASLGDLIGEADRRVIAGDFAAWLAESFRAALASSSDGWFDDDIAISRHWGFDLGAIDVPVTIWQGDDDRMVPLAHGQWLAEHVRGARAELRPGDGHLSITVARYGEILDDLLAG